MGACTLKSGNITNHPLPSRIPSSASAVLIYVQTEAGLNTGQDSSGRLEVYAVQSGRKYGFYVGAHMYGQNAWVVNSDNVWLPMTSSRYIHAQYIGAPGTGYSNCWVYAAGYYSSDHGL